MRCGRRRCLRPHPLFEGAFVRRPAPRGGSVPSRRGRCAGDDRCDGRRPRRTGSMPWTAAAVEGRAGRTSRMSFAARQLSLRCSSASSVFCLPTVVRRAPSAPVARPCGWPVKPCFGRAFRIHFCYRETYVCFPIDLSRLSFAFESGKWRRPKSFAWRDALA